MSGRDPSGVLRDIGKLFGDGVLGGLTRWPAGSAARSGRSRAAYHVGSSGSRSTGAAWARSIRRGTLARAGPRNFGRDARGPHYAYGPFHYEFARGRAPCRSRSPLLPKE